MATKRQQVKAETLPPTSFTYDPETGTVKGYTITSTPQGGELEIIEATVPSDLSPAETLEWAKDFLRTYSINQQATQAAKELDSREKVFAWLADELDRLQTPHPARARIEQFLSQPQLQKEPKSAKTTSSMELDPQAIVERALAEAPSPEPTPDRPIPEHPEPDTLGALETIARNAERLHGIVSQLRERNAPLTPTEAEVAVAGLHDIATLSAVTAWQLGLAAVQQGVMSQVQLSHMLKATQMTVSRRYRQGIDEAEKRKIARTDGRTLPL